MSVRFTTAPEVVYSPMVPAETSTTNSLSPDTAMPSGCSSPETRFRFTVAPDVVYLPTLPPWKFAVKCVSNISARLGAEAAQINAHTASPIVDIRGFFITAAFCLEVRSPQRKLKASAEDHRQYVLLTLRQPKARRSTIKWSGRACNILTTRFSSACQRGYRERQSSSGTRRATERMLSSRKRVRFGRARDRARYPEKGNAGSRF